MLVRQVNFTPQLRKGDWVAEFWSDFVHPHGWLTAMSRLRPGGELNIGEALRLSTPWSCLNMCDRLNNDAFKTTGMLAAQFFHPQTGLQLFRITMISARKPSKVYSGNEGSHVERDSRLLHVSPLAFDERFPEIIRPFGYWVKSNYTGDWARSGSRPGYFMRDLTSQ